MQANRRRDTGPEIRLRRELHHRGLRFRVDYRLAMANGNCRPDIAFTRARVAVFVDGCFWHSCSEHGTMPANNRAWWSAKFASNVARDRRNDADLKDAGWQVIRVWEHEHAVDAADRIARVIAAT
jgi:DNA mismatch endonuclease, patch repair protein